MAADENEICLIPNPLLLLVFFEKTSLSRLTCECSSDITSVKRPEEAKIMALPDPLSSPDTVISESKPREQKSIPKTRIIERIFFCISFLILINDTIAAAYLLYKNRFILQQINYN